MKLLVPVLIGEGNLLYPFAKGSKIMSSKAILNLKIAHYTETIFCALALGAKTIIKASIGININFFHICIMAIYIYLPYNLYKI